MKNAVAKTEIGARQINEIINSKASESNSIVLNNYFIKEPCIFDLLENKRIFFSQCNFSRSVSIYSSSSNVSITFTNCKFQDIVEGGGFISKSKLHFSHCEILNGLYIGESNDLNLHINESIGKGIFSLESITFSSCNFNFFRFADIDDENSISFRFSLFHSNSFYNAFLVNASFQGAQFKKYGQFDKCTFHYNSPPTSNFSNMKFEQTAYFEKTNFTQGAFFTGSTFEDIALFRNCNLKSIDCICDFTGTKFQRRAFFDNSQFKWISFENSEFKEIVSFKSINCLFIELNKCIFAQGADFLYSAIQSGSRESMRIIKHEFLKSNDLLQATVYQAKELTEHNKGLSWSKHREEKTVLFLNYVSNRVGLSWWQGVKFTFWGTVCFYVFYILTLGTYPGTFGWAGWESFWNAIHHTLKYFLKFFIITHDLDFMNKYAPSVGSYFIDTISRIFISYGIYQTVSAFRKHGKN